MSPEEFYDECLKRMTVREAGKFLSRYWPNDNTTPWKYGAWERWRKGKLGFRYSAKVALHRAAGWPDPPNEVTLVLDGNVEVHNYTDDPRVVVIVGPETKKVELLSAAPSQTLTATESVSPVVEVKSIILKRKPLKRHNLSLYDAKLFSRMQKERERLGVSWDDYFRGLTE